MVSKSTMRQSRNRLREPSVFNRRPYQTERPFKWWSDPIKLIPIVISSVAIIISYLGWRETHRGRRITEEINRPILAISSIEVSSNATDEKDGSINLFIVSKIKNLGRSTAIIEKVDVRPVLGPVGCGSSSFRPYGGRDDRAILANMEGRFSVGVTLTKECEQLQSLSFYVFLTLEYVDAGSGIKYNQHLEEHLDVSTDEQRKRREAQEKE